MTMCIGSEFITERTENIDASKHLQLVTNIFWHLTCILWGSGSRTQPIPLTFRSLSPEIFAEYSAIYLD